MGIAVLSRPISGASNWNAAGNPISYKFTRTDSGYTQINNAGGFLQIQINGVDVTAYFQVTNHVFIGAPLGVYSMGLITASAFSGGNTLITLDQPYTASIPAASPLVNNSKRTDYKLYVEVFKASDNTSLTSGVISTYSPLQTSLVYANISAVVKTFLSADWTDPSAVNEVETGTSLKVYIKWQEYYDGALQGSVTDDAANPIHAVFAAMQVGSTNGGNMLDYYPASSSRKFLQKFQPTTDFKKMVMWRDWPFTLSFIWPSGLGTTLYRKTFQYKADGTTTGVPYVETLLTAHTENINRIELPALEADAKRITVRLQTNFATSFSVPDPSFLSAFGVSWDNVAGIDNVWAGGTPGSVDVSLASGDTSRYLRSSALTPGAMSAGDNISSITIHALFDSGKAVSFRVWGWNGSAREIIGSVDAVGTGVATPYSMTTSVPTQNNTHIEIRANCTNVTGGNTVFVQQIDFVAAAVEDIVTEQLDIEIKDVCDYSSEYDGVLVEKNPIHLEWKNSSGGDSFWNFGKYHEYQYTYSNGRKAKRIQLFEVGIHPVQWEALQDLNGIGEVFQNSIPELTSSIVKTSTKRGQQVYIVNKAGTKKTGVIVINTSDSGFAKDNVNIFSVTIELPEVFGLE